VPWYDALLLLQQVQPWFRRCFFLYEILRKSEAYFKLFCGQAEAGIRSAHGRYMKYSVNPGRISSFVEGGPTSECGRPMAVIQ